MMALEMDLISHGVRLGAIPNSDDTSAALLHTIEVHCEIPRRNCELEVASFVSCLGESV